MHNIQVTHDVSPQNARSESSIAINPKNPQQIVAGSKKFKNIATYDFTLATEFSVNGGHTWMDSSDLAIPGWSGLTDPALTWDDSGNVLLVALALVNPPQLDSVG